MLAQISHRLRQDIHDTVRRAEQTLGVVNISVLAEAVRRRHLADNVALEDIAEAMIYAACAIGAPCVFDPEEQALLLPLEILPAPGRSAARAPLNGAHWTLGSAETTSAGGRDLQRRTARAEDETLQ